MGCQEELLIEKVCEIYDKLSRLENLNPSKQVILSSPNLYKRVWVNAIGKCFPFDKERKTLSRDKSQLFFLLETILLWLTFRMVTKH